MSAREEVLRRIRAALRDVPADERADDVAVPRGYRERDPAPASELVERFVERAGDYRATVRRVGAEALRDAIADACRSRGARRVGVPADLPDGWLPAELDAVVADGFAPDELDGLDGVVTGCALAIAETGTIALDDGPGQGRRALTLVPDYHLCVVLSGQIVGGVPEAMARLAAAAREGRPITLVSGPSATSDIELKRVEGVHGPRTLDVLVVDEADSARGAEEGDGDAGS